MSEITPLKLCNECILLPWYKCYSVECRPCQQPLSSLLMTLVHISQWGHFSFREFPTPAFPCGFPGPDFCLSNCLPQRLSPATPGAWSSGSFMSSKQVFPLVMLLHFLSNKPHLYITSLPSSHTFTRTSTLIHSCLFILFMLIL